MNAYRQANGLAPVPESQIESSRINIVDLRVSKGLRFGDRKLELIAQAFNLFNTKNLQAQFGSGRVGNALSATTFGRILSARPARQVELAARLNW